MKKDLSARIGIIGGSGFYDLADSLEEIKIETPYGSPSGKIGLGVVGGKKVAFLPRHGKDHDIPPHKINFRANIWALKSLGVERIIASYAAGSLQKEYKPGELVVLDQFIDRTEGRIDTFYDGPIATHVSTAFPFCDQTNKLTISIINKLGYTFHPSGTLVVIQGPRFSTAAESSWFTKMGWHAVNMTGYPEAALAREKEMCLTGIGIITDYDSGVILDCKVKPVSAAEVVKNFQENIIKVKTVIFEMIKNWPLKTTCSCRTSLSNSRF